MIGAFFAAKSLHERRDENETNGQLWVLHPQKFNESFGEEKEGFFSIGSEHVKALAAEVFRDSKEMPPLYKALALVGQEIDMRMTVQQSMFTMHGDKSDLRDHPQRERFLRVIAIPQAAKRKLLSEMATLGLRQMNLFPDLGHLADWLVERAIEDRLRRLQYIE